MRSPQLTLTFAMATLRMQGKWRQWAELPLTQARYCGQHEQAPRCE